MLIYQNLVNYLCDKISKPDYVIVANSVDGTWHRNRYIQVFNKNRDKGIHYEYSSHPHPQLELHFEGSFSLRNKEAIKDIYIQTSDHPHIEWLSWQEINNFGRCRLSKVLNLWSDIASGLRELMEIFEPLLDSMHIKTDYHPMRREDFHFCTELYKEKANAADEVLLLQDSKISNLFQLNLIIPNYQRIYCWEEENIKSLWHEIENLKDNYHLGSLILHQKIEEKGIEYHIVDGQQRLITLTLILLFLEYKEQLPLLYQEFHSTEACDYIANAKFIINQIIKKSSHSHHALEHIITHIRFSVLILTGNNLDLAYTFFSNQNSKGVPLSDFDLLKAHHLRYLATETQAEHLAKRWNEMTLSENETFLTETLKKHLYRLRKWSRKQFCEEWKPRYIKNEFSAALVMESIPAFGESFKFNEKIQGGAHFFAYAERFTFQFKEFSKLKETKLIRECLYAESHWKYADVIESLLFLYYIKFGHIYCCEALYCIANTIAQHRYSTKRAMMYKILEFAKESEIVMMIDQASSPTFFIAESLSQIKRTHLDLEEHAGIERRFYNQLCLMYAQLKSDITEVEIQQLLNNE